MNQKEYDLIAGILRDRLDDNNAMFMATSSEDQKREFAGRYFEDKILAERFVMEFSIYNSFDGDKFLKACGL